MTARDDEILDDLFHGRALAAYLKQAAIVQGWPDPEATRRLASRMYEKALAEDNAVFDIDPESVLISKEKGSP
jgi:hypothetical protein